MTRVSEPIQRETSASLPTAAISSPVAAIACALAMAGFELARTVRAEPTGDAVEILAAGSLVCAGAIAASLAAGAVAGRGGAAALAARWIARLAVSGLVFFGSLLALEAWVVPAALQDWYEVEALDGSGATLHEPDPETFWRMRPRFRGRLVHPELGGVLIETNSLGLRDREPEPCEEPAIVLGDSFGLGLGLQGGETLAGRLEALSVAPRVVNAGVAGFGTFDQAILLDRVASAYAAPSLVIAQIYVGNDLGENLAFLRRHAREHDRAWFSARFPGGESLFDGAAALEESGREVIVGAPKRSRLRNGIESRSRLGRLLFDRIARFAASRGEAPRGAPSNSMLVRSLEHEPDAEVRLAIEATAFALRAIAERASALGARFLACSVPAKVQVDAALFESALRSARLDPAAFDVGRPQADLARACAEAGIALVDFSDEFRERIERGERLYFAEGHWRPEAVAAAARAIAAALEAPENRPTPAASR